MGGRMQKEQLKAIHDHLLIKYINGLDYIRNNPNLPVHEVSEHYAILRELRKIEKRMKG